MRWSFLWHFIFSTQLEIFSSLFFCRKYQPTNICSFFYFSFLMRIGNSNILVKSDTAFPVVLTTAPYRQPAMAVNETKYQHTQYHSKSKSRERKKAPRNADNNSGENVFVEHLLNSTKMKTHICNHMKFSLNNNQLVMSLISSPQMISGKWKYSLSKGDILLCI